MRLSAICLIFGLLGTAACGEGPPADPSPQFALAGKEFAATEGLVMAGQPSEARVAELAASGFDLIVSINPAAKAPAFDEAAVVRGAGLAYKHLPVSKKTVLDVGVREQAYKILDEIEAADTKTYFHCSTSNRCGALWALYQAERKQLSAAEALAEGKRVGLTKLEPAVRKLLGLPAK